MSKEVSVNGLAPVTLSVDLRSIFGMDEEEEITNRLSSEIAARFVKDNGRLRDLILHIQDAEIREQIKPVIADAMRQGSQRTNEYGQPIGAPKTLSEHIGDEVRAHLQKRAGYGGKRSLLEEVMAQEVERALRKELTQVVADAKKEVLEAVKNEAASIIADSVRRATAR